MTGNEMNATMKGIETLRIARQAFLIQQRMIEYLAKKAWKHGFGESLPDAKYCRKLNDEACDFVCWKCWIDAAFDKVVNNVDGK